MSEINPGAKEKKPKIEKKKSIDIDENTPDSNSISQTISQDEETEIPSVDVAREMNLSEVIIEGVFVLNNISSTKRKFTDDEKDCIEKLIFIADKYNSEIEEAICPLRNKPNSNRFQQFVRIVRRIILKGINWGRIAVILGLAVAFVKIAGRDLLERITGYLLELIKDKLINWIIESGGWSSLKQTADEISEISRERTLNIILGVASLSMLVYILYTRK